MKNLFCFCVLLLCVSGCTSTTVHLHARYLDKPTTEQLESVLEEQGFTVKTNDFAFPTDIHRSSIVYSVLLKDKQAVDNLTATMTAQGIEIGSVSPLVAGKHWFTKNSLGLYVIPEGVSPHSGKASADIANTYQSDSCEETISITLKADLTFSAKTTGEVPADIALTGTWHIDNYPVLTLTPAKDGWPWYFEINRATESDKISTIDVTRLTPMNNRMVLRDCPLSHGIRRT